MHQPVYNAFKHVKAIAISFIIAMIFLTFK